MASASRLMASRLVGIESIFLAKGFSELSQEEGKV